MVDSDSVAHALKAGFFLDAPFSDPDTAEHFADRLPYMRLQANGAATAVGLPRTRTALAEALVTECYLLAARDGKIDPARYFTRVLRRGSAIPEVDGLGALLASQVYWLAHEARWPEIRKALSAAQERWLEGDADDTAQRLHHLNRGLAERVPDERLKPILRLSRSRWVIACSGALTDNAQQIDAPAEYSQLPKRMEAACRVGWLQACHHVVGLKAAKKIATNATVGMNAAGRIISLALFGACDEALRPETALSVLPEKARGDVCLLCQTDGVSIRWFAREGGAWLPVEASDERVSQHVRSA